MVNMNDKVVSLTDRALKGAEPLYEVTVFRHGNTRRYAFPTEYKDSIVKDMRDLADYIEENGCDED